MITPTPPLTSPLPTQPASTAATQANHANRTSHSYTNNFSYTNNNINHHPVIANVNLTALQHNCDVIRKTAPRSKILAVVKSNAYGHGIVPVAQAVDSKVDAFGLAWLNEAIRIKESGVTKPLLLLKGVLTQGDLLCANSYGLDMVVHNFHQIELIEKTALHNPFKVWLKIDTGMHRLGFQPQDVAAAYQRLMKHPKIIKPLCLMTHFSDADDTNNAKTAGQIELFNRIVTDLKLEGEKCLANSGGTVGWPQAHTDWVRSGILMYGASPMLGSTGKKLGLKPAMTMVTKILSIQHLTKGAQIGYGSTWSCPEDMPVGLVNAGYGDGYPRNAPSGTPLLINSVRCPLIGRVSMDIMSVDLRPCPQAKIGDEVILWGEGLPIEEVAHGANTVAYELFCHITQRVCFKYSHNHPNVPIYSI
jgi:alanine racemase